MLKPYFETENGILYQGDNLAIMPQFADKQFDLVLTDPPYGINADKSAHKASGFIAGGKTGFTQYPKTVYRYTEWDKETPPAEAFEQISRISGNQIIFGGNYFINYLAPSPCWIVWDKEANGNFADCELAYTSFPTAVRKFRYRWNGMLKEVPEKRYHPTQKPVGLFRQILDKYAKAGQVICDPYAGSGTTAIACEQLGLKWVCIEQDAEYCEIIAQRVNQETQQLKLFGKHNPSIKRTKGAAASVAVRA